MVEPVQRPAVDLRRPRADLSPINEVILRWETAFGADYQVQVSNDATDWTTIRTVIGGDGGVDDLRACPGPGATFASTARGAGRSGAIRCGSSKCTARRIAACRPSDIARGTNRS